MWVVAWETTKVGNGVGLFDRDRQLVIREKEKATPVGNTRAYEQKSSGPEKGAIAESSPCGHNGI